MCDIDDNTRIAVVNEKNKFLSYTHPARVRKLLKQGKAEIFSQDPFTIRLKGERGAKMQPVLRRPIKNFTEYFKEERDVYVQNASNNQVSLQFETSPGRFDSVLIPRTRKPFNLTQHVPFEAIKRSTDIRRLVNRDPAVLRLMSYEEYEAYYQKLAEINDTSADEEIVKAENEQAGLMNKTAYLNQETEKPKTIDQIRDERAENPEEAAEEEINPKIVGLCAQVGPDVDDDHKLSEGEFMAELEILEPMLTVADVEYLQGAGFYPLVKKWAGKKLAELTTVEAEPKSKKKPSKKKN